MTGPPPPDADRAAEGAEGEPLEDPYDDLRDGVLRGLAHELSNRTGTIGAVAEALLATDPSSRLALALRGEAARLDDLLRVARLLPADPGRPAEPVRPADLFGEAAAVFALHPAGRDLAVALERAEEAPPVRVRVPAAVRRVVALLIRAGDAGASLAATWRLDGEVVVLAVGDGEVRLPTLAAARARERPPA